MSAMPANGLAVTPGETVSVEVLERARRSAVIPETGVVRPLGAGYRVEARVVTWNGGDVLNVLTSALSQDASSWAVFVVRDGRAVRQPVEIGHQSAHNAEIAKGLAEGERVILYPSALIEDGVAVRTSGS